ncbi:hypothetical protein J6590_055487 [Homalodisca vitripennis]|nr:hypothetical protein J6590_055487 [Homalodisca vitripennis]
MDWESTFPGVTLTLVPLKTNGGSESNQWLGLDKRLSSTLHEGMGAGSGSGTEGIGVAFGDIRSIKVFLMVEEFVA